MLRVLGIETSCDETGAAVFDVQKQQLLSHTLYSQIKDHERYGGVVPEIASRSQLEKIAPIVQMALDQAHCTLQGIGTIAVTHTPGLAGSLLVGICFAKGLAYITNKKIIGVNHLEGHIFSPFLNTDGTINRSIEFPHLCLSVSGGHTGLYYVSDFGSYKLICQTIDDAAGEAFDKISKMLGLGYPGGPVIEKLATQLNFEDFFNYPRTKQKPDNLFFSFSGLKTAVLYGLVKLDAYNLKTGPILNNITPKLQQQVASSLLVCIADIFGKTIIRAFKLYPETKSLTFSGGVACNNYLRTRLQDTCSQYQKQFFAASPSFCTDNGAMIAFVGSYKATQNKYSDLTLDVVL